MDKVFLFDDAIISPLGFSTGENLDAIRAKRSGLKPLESYNCFAGKVGDEHLNSEFSKLGNPMEFTRLEKMMVLAINEVLTKNAALDITKTGLIISTTKGNIDLLRNSANFPKDRLLLTGLAERIRDFFRFTEKPLIVSNACISGGLALAVAKRFINSGKFDNAIVVAGDLLSDFVLSGFNSFQAMSPEACRPFSRNREGISLGEAAAAILIGKDLNKNSETVSLIGEASTNDANHISGPSRTGEGLYRSIRKALDLARISAGEIDYLSAHGTATIFNDEMEAIAFNRAGLQHVPLNSLKGYYGHSLGASALIESIITKHSLLNNQLYPSLNFGDLGVSKPMNVIRELKIQNLKVAMKTASGFGGCNLALVFKKEVHG